MSTTFADLVNEAMKRKRTPEGKPWSDYTLAGAIGLLPGDKPFNAKQVWRLRRGERQHLTRELVERIASALDINLDEAFFAAGIWPSGLTLEGYRQYRALAAVGTADVHGTVTAPYPIRPASGVVVPFRRDRRRRHRPEIGEVAA